MYKGEIEYIGDAVRSVPFVPAAYLAVFFFVCDGMFPIGCFMVLLLEVLRVFVFGGNELERERDIERKLKKRVESNGGWCLKFISSVSGVPDRLCLFPLGRAVFVETKIRGGKPRPLQKRQMERIRKLGFDVRVVDSEQDIQELINDMEEKS